MLIMPPKHIQSVHMWQRGKTIEEKRTIFSAIERKKKMKKKMKKEKKNGVFNSSKV